MVLKSMNEEGTVYSRTEREEIDWQLIKFLATSQSKKHGFSLVLTFYACVLF